MFGSSMLDIAIGIIFIFLLMSILATAINEILLSSMNLRGKYLLNGIRSLLNEDDDKSELKLVTQVYNHGQVCGLYKGEFESARKKHLPSYIPSRNFALALIGVLEEVGEGLKPALALPHANPPQAAPADTSGTAPSGDVPQDSGLPAADTLLPATAPNQQPTTTPTAVVSVTTGPIKPNVDIPATIRSAAAHLADTAPKVGKPLVAMMAMAGHDCAAFQKAIEDWYNSGMDRVSGWYKYHTQKTLFIIGLVIAITLNANTIRMVRQISNDPTMRQAMVAAAQSAKPPADTAQAGIDKQMEVARASFTNITDLGIPLGWPRWYSGGKEWSEAALGWLITAIAVSLGAPFWFDILNKIMVIRSTVKPAEKSQDEASKDK